MVVAEIERAARLPEKRSLSSVTEMHFDVVQVSPVRALVYTYPAKGGLREVALVWRPGPRSAWRCALCNMEACMHLRAFREASGGERQEQP